MQIYKPAEDSFLFQEFLRRYFSKNKSQKIKFLDVGTGSGILAKTALEFLPTENITALDVNPKAVQALKLQPFKVIESNFFERISESFDIITFNAPYLPEDKREPQDSRVATTGGKEGDEASLEFLLQAKSHLNSNGKIFLLISSLTPLKKIKQFWNYKIVSRKKIFMEELLILEFTKT